MNTPLLDYKEVECSVREVSIKPRQPQSISGLGEMQLFDLSGNYAPLFNLGIPKAFYPKQITYFRSSKDKSKWVQLMKQIPVFHPMSIGILLWQFCMVIIIFFYFFYIPFKISFTDTIHEENPDDIAGIYYFIRFSIVVLSVDLVVSFNTGIYQYGQLILSRKTIALTYLQWAFELDLIGVLSLSLALLLRNDYIRYLFYLRAYYVLRFSDKIDTLLQLRNNLRATYKLLQLVITVLFVTHIMACFFYGTAQVQYNNGETTWLQYNDFYVDEDEMLANQGIWPKYVVSFYWSMTTVSTVGYGDITPKNDKEIGIALITMVIAGMVFAFNVASIREVIIGLNEKSARFTAYKIVMNRYMDIKNISPTTQSRILEYLEYLWQEEKNRSHSVEQTLINSLAPDLKEQLYYETYINFLKLPCFNNQGYSELFLRSIALDMQEDHFGPGEVLLYQDLEKEDIYLYYIVKGNVLIYLERNRSYDDEMKIDWVPMGKCFGEVSFFTGEPYPFSVKSLTYASVYRLARSKFLAKLDNFQKDFETYHTLLAQRYSNRFYEMLDTRCLTCSQFGHYQTECNITHYVPNVQMIIRQINIHDDENSREFHERRPRKKVQTLLQHFEYKSVAQELMMHEKKLGRRVTKAYNNQSMDLSGYHEYSDNSDDEQQDEHFQDELLDIKSMLSTIMHKLGIEIKEEQNIRMQRPFMPSKPVYEPKEVSFDIDKIKNYDIFQCNYNFNRLQYRL